MSLAIKRFCFGEAVALPPLPPLPIQPLRAVRCEPLDGAGQAFTLEWFAHDTDLNLFATGDPGTVMTREHVRRGADWLEQRWRAGSRKWKHVALARRAPDMSAEEFSARWLAKAGTAATKGAQAPAPIPAEARGLAYCQNHAVALTGSEWRWDAITEVWFDDAASLQVREAWFRDNLASDPLFSETCLFGVTEDLVAI